MQDLILWGVPYDTWMNILASLGVFLLFLAYWLESRKLGISRALLKIPKLVGLGFVCIPLFSRWFLSESLLLLTGAVIAMISGCMIFLRRRGI
jgi:multidrug transporter EmrE-like cation transporter